MQILLYVYFIYQLHTCILRHLLWVGIPLHPSLFFPFLPLHFSWAFTFLHCKKVFMFNAFSEETLRKSKLCKTEAAHPHVHDKKNKSRYLETCGRHASFVPIYSTFCRFHLFLFLLTPLHFSLAFLFLDSLQQRFSFNTLLCGSSLFFPACMNLGKKGEKVRVAERLFQEHPYDH